MERRRARARFLVILAAVAAAAACSDATPVEPVSSPDDVRLGVQSSVPGSYAIFFMRESPTGLTHVETGTAPVNTYVVLRSEIRDNAGNLAQTGTVTYEYCWANGTHAPKAACDSRSGSWRRLLSMPVDPIGSRAGFGACSTPRAIGFRVKYSGKRGGVASGVSVARDFTWTSI